MFTQRFNLLTKVPGQGTRARSMFVFYVYDSAASRGWVGWQRLSSVQKNSNSHRKIIVSINYKRSADNQM